MYVMLRFATKKHKKCSENEKNIKKIPKNAKKLQKMKTFSCKWKIMVV